jgi:beta-glucosidase
MDERDYAGANTTPDANGDLVYSEGVKLGYRGLTRARHTLGSGMGYARFEWRDVAAEAGGVAVTVRNFSDRAGSDVVQLYRDTPECALLGFAKVRLEPGEERRIVVTPEPRMMRIWQDGWRDLGAEVKLRLARDAEDGHAPTN